MRRKAPPTNEFVPSTTRAVAWGALFFSLLAFLISMATLFLTWHDGRLVKNSRMLLDGLDKTVQTWSASRKTGSAESAAAPSAEAEDPAQAAGWARIREKIDQVRTMVDAGDDSARYYLDNLVEELGPMRDHASSATSQWVGQAVQTLQQTREQIRDNAPQAVRNLRALSESLSGKPGDEPSGSSGTDITTPADDPLGDDLNLDDSNP